jgi:hypothetical protein
MRGRERRECAATPPFVHSRSASPKRVERPCRMRARFPMVTLFAVASLSSGGLAEEGTGRTWVNLRFLESQDGNRWLLGRAASLHRVRSLRSGRETVLSGRFRQSAKGYERTLERLRDRVGNANAIRSPAA